MQIFTRRVFTQDLFTTTRRLLYLALIKSNTVRVTNVLEEEDSCSRYFENLITYLLSLFLLRLLLLVYLEKVQCIFLCSCHVPFAYSSRCEMVLLCFHFRKIFNIQREKFYSTCVYLTLL